MNKDKDKNSSKLEEIDIMTGEYVKIHYDVVRPSRRLFGALIDLFLIGALYFLFVISLHDVSNILAAIFGNKLADIILYVIGYLIITVNMFTEYITHGKTLGKLLLGTVVVTNECLTPTFAQCFVRWLLFPIDMLLIGILLIDHYGSRLGDLAGGCVVVYGDSVVHTKVNPELEFRFAEPDFKPTYEAVKDFTPNEMNAIRRVLYVHKYKPYTKEVAKLVRKKLDEPDYRQSDSSILHTVMQDCLYYKNLK